MNSPRSIQEAGQSLRSGKCSPLELLDACLERIDLCEPSVQAWVSIDADGARRAARELTNSRRATSVLPPLWGIPIGVKDVFDIAEQPTLAGARIRAGHRAAADATAVARLRQAGAIILGKTVTTEFACFDPPPTRNPWNLDHTPGGSSSGSAAALSLGMCLGALGTQTGGSIIRPASYCGVCGLKPSYGRVSFAGVVGVTTHLDHAGPLARSVGDLAILFELMGGEDSRDPLASRRPIPACQLTVAKGVAQPPRLGQLAQYFLDESDSEVRAVVLSAIARLAAAGAPVVPAGLPASFAQARAMHRRIMVVEALALHRETFPARRAEYGPNIAGLLDEGLRTSAVDYADALRHQAFLRREILSSFAGVDVLVMPSTDTAAPGIDSTGSPKLQSPWSYTGLPAVTMPCGLTATGLPVGLQLVGRPWSEDHLLAIAAWCEKVLEFDAQPMLAAH